MRLCIIPARGGSKRIPRKNLKCFLETPVIINSIKSALDSGLFDYVVVSTDDEEIALIAKAHGAKVPWLRPKSLSGDKASTNDVVQHALKKCQNLYGNFIQGCCIYPVNPFLTVDFIKRGLNELESHGAHSAFPVVSYEFPIEQALFLKDGQPRFVSLEAVEKNSQDLSVHYHDIGMFYWFDVKRFNRNPKLFSDNSVAFPLNQLLCQDINTIEDWTLAELKYQHLITRRKK